ncbi:hypothetical protein PV963_13850 [Streptomyces coeruleorubidus]|uniref:hypothetical protein n=1 Tax=Streptomyces coeruleorubidus TaxID=116188 RepID=UPI00237FBFD3|nr:hypothetical protein [Streptomyces coeruleorubidus]WDV51382.1 hypothetical protein PV963_13850 [Streptomyces coeruleorubidus]
MSPVLPHPTDLTHLQYAGWNCVRCNASLRNGGVSVGFSRGGVGAYDLDVEVYACGSKCPKRPGSKPERKNR